MTQLHEAKIKRHYEMLYGLWVFNKDDPEFLDHKSETGKSNENIIADHIIAPVTWFGSFNKKFYSLEAVENLFYHNKKIETHNCIKNQIDHVVKTKQIARISWSLMDTYIKNSEDFILFLKESIKLCTITKSQNKDSSSREKDFYIDRYRDLGIDFVYKKSSKIRWSKIRSIEDLMLHFEKISTIEAFK